MSKSLITISAVGGKRRHLCISLNGMKGERYAWLPRDKRFAPRNQPHAVFPSKAMARAYLEQYEELITARLWGTDAYVTPLD